jgi:hypothetical protein
MEEQLISLETAKLTKEKGFKISTQKAYINDILFINFESSDGNERDYYFDADDFYNNWNKKNWVFNLNGGECFGCKLDNKRYFEAYSAPTQSLLQKWLREEMDMWVTIIFNGITYSISIYGRYTPDEEEIEISDTGSLNFEDKYFLRYEQALEEGLQEALKLITNK